MNKYEQADRELAELLGYTRIDKLDNGQFICFLPGCLHSNAFMPRWTQDDGECFLLMVEYEIPVDNWRGSCWVGSGDDSFFQVEQYNNHKDKATATRYAIVQAVISKLKEN